MNNLLKQPVHWINSFNMNFAKAKDFEAIKQIFYKHKMHHVRTDYMKQMIEMNRFIYQDGVVISFHHAKRKQSVGEIPINKGDTVLHQIANKEPGNGNGKKMLLKFFDWCEKDVYLSVKADNYKACEFYKRMGMKDIGEHNWTKVKGRVYVKQKEVTTLY